VLHLEDCGKLKKIVSLSLNPRGREGTGRPGRSGGDHPVGSGRKIALGSDHGGFELKTRLVGFLQGLGYQVLDLGTHSKEACDYPDFARAVAQAWLRAIATPGS